MECVDAGSDDVELIIRAAKLLGLSGDIVHVSVDLWIFQVGCFIGYCIETGSVDHAIGDATCELLDLFPNVQQEGIR